MLYIEDVESELQRKDNYTWTPAQRQYVADFPNMSTHQCIFLCRNVSPTSRIRAEIQMKSGHSIFAKYREASEVIDLHGLFSDYWSSNNHEFTVMRQ